MYSPKIKEEFIPAIYRIARDRKKPMTAIVNEMIAEVLTKHEREVKSGVVEVQEKPQEAQ